jgi:ubiquinone/menaquinone biosynthesis C-methylase UbiE
MHSLHAFARRLHGGPTQAPATQAPATETRGLILDQGWSYDLMTELFDAVLFRGQIAELRRRAADLARLQPGEQALDVGCGTGTLALVVQRRVGATGRVVGIDPGPQQIARARAKAAQLRAPVEFQVGVIERLDFPDQTFDVVFSTLMMHHLPDSLKRQGLAEIARALKPGGRLVIADFKRKQERQSRAARIHAGGSDMRHLADLAREAGFSRVETEEMRPRRFSAFPGASYIRASR